MASEQIALPIFDRALTPAERRTLNQKGRKRKGGGYAAMPGSGRAGETCGSCQHLVRRKFGKAYPKCGLMHAHWTRGPGTDVRVRAPACSRWEAEHAPSDSNPSDPKPAAAVEALTHA